MSLWVLFIDSIQSIHIETYFSKVHIQHILLNLKTCIATSIREIEVATKIAKNAENRKTRCYEVYKSILDSYRKNGNATMDDEQKQLLNTLKNDWIDSLSILKQATIMLKELKVKLPIINSRALNELLGYLTKIHNERRGVRENALEDATFGYPINAKQNPFCNQRLNRGDCTRLMVNYKLLFEKMTKACKYESRKA